MAESAHPHLDTMRGIALRLAAVVVFSMMGALLKLGAVWGAKLGELIFLRCLFGTIVVLAWVLPREGSGGLLPRRPLNLFGRNALGIVAMLASFEALVILPLAEATTIGFTAPIFATFLSWLILREPVGRHRWLAAIVAFLGVVVVMRPGAGGSGAIAPIGVALALGGAVFGASVTIALRHMAGVERVGAIAFWFQLAGACVGGLLIVINGTGAGIHAVLILMLAGLFGGLGQLLMTGSLHAAPVAVLAPFDYLQLVLAALLGWLLFGTEPTLYTWAGAFLIAGSGLYTAWRENRRSRGCAAATSRPVI